MVAIILLAIGALIVGVFAHRIFTRPRGDTLLSLNAREAEEAEKDEEKDSA